ncbi:arsenate reductase [Flavobacterium akiainvivens]|uniref:Arsenate reductase n=1 Tax=Flavobacterium akiainvivens TaxID=1202724 RepID=A0A0M9VIN1_9FLAO|nr:ArsC/Spx/MgsR family protein [Flavobacterium akiainvivens]KOS06890.1 arsenate reductase [Flavobacterium akiainvivens]SFQ69527.1 Arsenate reductase, glutaredoxin family [Flavobacterium akiainvivens]
MKKIYHLKTCSTNAKILKQLPNLDKFELQEIKANPLTEAQLEELHKMAGSYEALFSRNASLYKERGLKDKPLTEEDYKNLILEHYTFLKRPVIVSGDHVFIGNKAKTVEDAIDYLK